MAHKIGPFGSEWDSLKVLPMPQPLMLAGQIACTVFALKIFPSLSSSYSPSPTIRPPVTITPALGGVKTPLKPPVFQDLSQTQTSNAQAIPEKFDSKNFDPSTVTKLKEIGQLIGFWGFMGFFCFFLKKTSHTVHHHHYELEILPPSLSKAAPLQTPQKPLKSFGEALLANPLLRLELTLAKDKKWGEQPSIYLEDLGFSVPTQRFQEIALREGFRIT